MWMACMGEACVLSADELTTQTLLEDSLPEALRVIGERLASASYCASCVPDTPGHLGRPFLVLSGAPGAALPTCCIMNTSPPALTFFPA